MNTIPRVRHHQFHVALVACALPGRRFASTATPDASTRSDRGESLIEILVSVAIIGIAFAGIMGAVMMTSSASHMADSTSKARDVLQGWAERLEESTYDPCATPGAATVLPGPDGWSGSAPSWTRSDPDGFQYTASVEGIEYWTSDPSPGWETGCPRDPGLQRWQLQVNVPGIGLPDATEDLFLVRRNPCTTTSSVGCSS